MPQIKLRYEWLKTHEDFHDEEVKAPDGWETMTDHERHQWCVDALTEGLNDYISTSYEWEGME